MDKRQPVQKRGIETVKKIREAAVCLLQNEGVRAFNIRKITRAAGVSTGAFYEYFKSREELLLSIYSDRFKKKLTVIDQELLSDGEVSAGERLERYYQRLQAEKLVSSLDLALLAGKGMDSDISVLASLFERELLKRYRKFIRKFGKGNSVSEVRMLAKYNLDVEQAGMRLLGGAKGADIQVGMGIQLELTFKLLDMAGVELTADQKAKLKQLFSLAP